MNTNTSVARTGKVRSIVQRLFVRFHAECGHTIGRQRCRKSLLPGLLADISRRNGLYTHRFVQRVQVYALRRPWFLLRFLANILLNRHRSRTLGYGEARRGYKYSLGDCKAKLAANRKRFAPRLQPPNSRQFSAVILTSSVFLERVCGKPKRDVYGDRVAVSMLFTARFTRHPPKWLHPISNGCYAFSRTLWELTQCSVSSSAFSS